MMMGYVITVHEDEFSVRVCISHAGLAHKAYRWARARGHNVTMTESKVAIPDRTEEEASIAQDILNDWVDHGLLLG
jgi:hypothetical protein